MTKPPKPRQPIPKIAIIGLTFSVIVAAIGLTIIIIMYRFLTADDRARKRLESGLSLMPIPPGCSEPKLQYQKSDIDAVSTYSFLYKCDTTGAIAHDAIVAKLKSQGFTIMDDNSLPLPASKGVSYDFSYKSQNYVVRYRFLPDTFTNLEARSIDQLHSAKVTEIGASLTEY
jgi:hypothetical protein